MAVTIDELQLEIEASASNAAGEIERTAGALGVLKKTVTKSLLNNLSKLSEALDGIKAPITVNVNAKGLDTIKGAISEAVAGTPVNAATAAPIVDSAAATSGLQEIKEATEQVSGGFRTVSDEVANTNTKLNAAGVVAAEAGEKLRVAGASAKTGAKGFGKFLESVKRVAMYRAIRFILKQITSAAKEGIQNLAQYSKAIGEVDASHANTTMSQFASMGMQVKNTIGAALMPVLYSLTPVIQTVANWFIIAANAVNQFFAAISGTSEWTRAKEYAVDYAGGLDKATGAARALKNATLGIDELNIIGPDVGSGAATPNFKDMFEDAGVSEKISAFADKIKPIISWIKDNFETIKTLAVTIGGLMLAWKVSTGIASFIGSLLTLSKSKMFISGLTISLGGAAIETQGIVDAIKNELNGLNFAEILGGGGLFVLGTTLIGKSLGSAILGGAIGGIVAGIPMFVTGAYDAIKNGIDWLSGLLIPVGATAAGAGIGAIVGSLGGPLTAGIGALAGLIVGALTDLGILIYQKWDDIRKAVIDVWNKVRDFFVTAIPEGINRIVEWFAGLPERIGYELGYVVGRIVAWGEDIGRWIETKVPKLIEGIVSWFAKLPGRVKEKLDLFKGTITAWKENAIKWFSEELPHIINSVIDWFAKLPDALVGIGKNMIRGLWNGIVSMGDWLWSKVSDFFGSAWDIFSDFFRGFGRGVAAGYDSVQRFASGGFPASGHLFIANEAGPELVGTMGGRTTVANNGQIEAGIEAAAYRGFMRAMADGGGKELTVNVNSFLDGEQVYTNQEKVRERRGYPVGLNPSFNY